MTVEVRNNNKTPLVVPSNVRRKAGFKSGQELEIRASGGVITITPKMPNADDEYTGAERRALDAQLAAADEDIRAGRVFGPFDSAEEMAESIEGNIRQIRRAKRKTKPAR